MIHFLASLARRFRLFVRPEIFSFVFLVLNIGILLRLRGGRPRLVYALLPVQLMWANIPPSFLFGFVGPGRVLTADVLPRSGLAPGWDRLRLDGSRLRHLALATAALPAPWTRGARIVPHIRHQRSAPRYQVIS